MDTDRIVQGVQKTLGQFQDGKGIVAQAAEPCLGGVKVSLWLDDEPFALLHFPEYIVNRYLETLDSPCDFTPSDIANARAEWEKRIIDCCREQQARKAA